MLKQLDVLIGFVVVMSIVSLLITIITQTVSSLLGLRGKNLRDAIQVMIRRINPNITPDAAADLATHVLTRSVISDSILSMKPTFWDKWVPVLSWFRKKAKNASAIRADELLELVRDVTTRAPFGIAPEQAQALRQTATDLLNNLNAATPALTNAIAAFQTQFNTIAGRDLVQARDLIQHVGAATDVGLINIEKWFNSAQDRAQQWFAMHTRIITMIAGFIVAFILQLDTIDLLARISADSDLRDKLVAGSATVQDLAGKTAAQPYIDQTAHSKAVASLKKKYKNLTPAFDEARDFPSIEAAGQWVTSQAKKDSLPESLATDYTQQLATSKLEESLDTIKRVAGSSPLQLLPAPYPISFNQNWPHGRLGLFHIVKFTSSWSWPPHRLLGILISAALLSLGAPFWFNTLKSLTNLRPKLAEEIDKDPKQIPESTSSN